MLDRLSRSYYLFSGLTFVNASGVNFILNRMSSLEVGMFEIRADLHSIVDFLLSTLHLFFSLQPLCKAIESILRTPVDSKPEFIYF